MNRFLLLAQESAESASWSERGAENLSRLGDWLAMPSSRLIVAAVVAAVGIWLMLPNRRRAVRRAGGCIAAVAGGLLFSVLPALGDTLASGVFASLAALTTVAAVATITSRNPVYSAIWFALTLLGTGGLFLANGAQFLAVATVAVYAGAIVVTFLFVLMLSQPEGLAAYDRVSWGTWPSVFGTVVGMGFILLSASAVLRIEPAEAAATAVTTAEESTVPDVLADQHVARLGGELFTRHLVAVQAGGALLLAALVGAVAIASAGKPRRGPSSRITQPLAGAELAGRTRGTAAAVHEGGGNGE